MLMEQQLNLYYAKEFCRTLRYGKASEKQVVYPPRLPPSPPPHPTYLYGMHFLSLRNRIILLHEFVT